MGIRSLAEDLEMARHGRELPRVDDGEYLRSASWHMRFSLREDALDEDGANEACLGTLKDGSGLKMTRGYRDEIKDEIFAAFEACCPPGSLDIDGLYILIRWLNFDEEPAVADESITYRCSAGFEIQADGGFFDVAVLDGVLRRFVESSHERIVEMAIEDERVRFAPEWSRGRCEMAIYRADGDAGQRYLDECRSMPFPPRTRR